MGEWMQSYPVIGGPLDGSSQAVLSSVKNFKVPVGAIEIVGVSLTSSGGAPAYKADAFYEYSRAEHEGVEAFVPSKDDDLIDRLKICEHHAEPTAIFLIAELICRGLSREAYETLKGVGR